MSKERIFEVIKKPRISGLIGERRSPLFIHIGEIIPEVLKDIERRVKTSRQFSVNYRKKEVI